MLGRRKWRKGTKEIMNYVDGRWKKKEGIEEKSWGKSRW